MNGWGDTLCEVAFTPGYAFIDLFDGIPERYELLLFPVMFVGYTVIVLPCVVAAVTAAVVFTPVVWACAVLRDISRG